MEKKRQEHFKNLPRCTKGLIFPHWPEGVCNPECGECSPSDPPSPERVCPHCKGSGQFRVDVSIRRHVSGMSDVISCAYCHGTGKVPSPEPPEKVRDSVRKFAIEMERVLKANDYKRGWRGETLEYLERRLKEEFHEHIFSTDKDELVDIANFCMMIFEKLQGELPKE